MDQTPYFFLLETAIKWRFKCIFAFKLRHKAASWLIQFPYKETSSHQKIILVQTVESLIWLGEGGHCPPPPSGCERRKKVKA